MKSNLTRREFIRRSALTAGALTAGSVFAPNIIARPGPSDELKVVQIGCGGRSMDHLKNVIGKNHQMLYAIVDPDEKKHRSVQGWCKTNNIDPTKHQVFTDYRRMFDKIGKEVDAVFVTTPNHHHALVSMIAMQLGKNVYCEKPVCHDIAEARELRAMARKYNKVATQMGNQGHCEEGYHRLCEFIWGGVIGNVTETHSWTNRANGGVGPRPKTESVPPGMHWDEWIGPAPYRDFHSDIHPHEWHGWYDFGNGSIGNMGCHVLDGVYWSLKLEHPTSVEVEEMRGGSDERYPTGSRIRWDCAARGDMPAVKVYWYEGLNQATKLGANGTLRTAAGEARNLPPMFLEFQKQYPDEEFDSSGTFYVGDKGVIYTGCYGDRMHVMPMEKMKEIKQPPKTMPRPKDIFTDFITACREGRTDTSAPFEYGTRLTEFTLLANLAQHAGPGKKVEWDGPGMQVTNFKELNAWVKRDYRKGWQA